MVDDSGSGLTRLQRQIVHSVAHGSGQVRDVAEELDCSKSYVRTVMSEYDQQIEAAKDLSDADCLPVFFEPYSIFFQQEALDHLSLSEGDVLKLTGTHEGETEVTYGKVKQIDPDFFTKETLARVSGAYFSAEQLNGSNNDSFNTIPTLSNGRANPHSAENFHTLIQSVETSLRKSVNFCEPDMLIGAGILEVIHGKRDPTDVISTPYFTFEKSSFVSYVSDDFPDIVDIQLHVDTVQEPEEVYFTCYGERLTDSQRAELQESLLSQEYFKSNWNYAQPGTGSLVGPTSTEITSDLVRVIPEAIRVVPGITQSVSFYEEDGSPVTNLDIETVYEAIQDAEPEFDALDATRGGVDREFPIRRDGESLSFLFDQVTLVLTPRGDSIEWQRPAEVSMLDTFVSAVNRMIASQLDIESIQLGDPQEPQYTRVDDDHWAFDTNTLYHDHVGDEPSTILHTVMAHPFFEGTTIHIPWAVLFEFNKHADPGEGTNRMNRQGFENLTTLRTLEKLGYLTVAVQDLPSEIDGGLNIGDIADMYMLAHADEVGARLVTGDHTLQELGHLADVPVVNVADLKTYSAPIEGESPDEVVLPRVGDDIHKKSDIIREIESLINSDSSLRPVEGSQPSPFDPQSTLDRWCSTERLAAFYDSAAGETCYAHRCDLTVVPTSSVIPQLAEYTNDETNLFTRQLKDHLEAESAGFPIDQNEFPFVHLLVPTEYVVREMKPGQGPSGFNTKLLKLQRLRGLQYSTTSAFTAQSEMLKRVGEATDNGENEGEVLSLQDYLGLCLASATDDAILLVNENQTGLWKFSHLFGVDALRLTSQTE
ncbi:hypothetical protein [Haloferax sulfurifontis]|nr:hypothetical protein [Haloferax sulfurifontis]